MGNDVINDFNLFKYAKHFIVGPSTFHWWGAWLNNSPNKIDERDELEKIITTWKEKSKELGTTTKEERS